MASVEIHQWQVWEIEMSLAAWALHRKLRFMHLRHLPMANSGTEKRTAFCPFCKGKMPTKTTREKRTAFCLVYTQKLPKNYGCLSLNYGTILANHSTVPRPFQQLECIFAPPPDICLRSMGRCTLLILPLPWIPSGSTRYGACEGGSNTG